MPETPPRQPRDSWFDPRPPEQMPQTPEETSPEDPRVDPVDVWEAYKQWAKARDAARITDAQTQTPASGGFESLRHGATPDTEDAMPSGAQVDSGLAQQVSPNTTTPGRGQKPSGVDSKSPRGVNEAGSLRDDLKDQAADTTRGVDSAVKTGAVVGTMGAGAAATAPEAAAAGGAGSGAAAGTNAAHGANAVGGAHGAARTAGLKDPSRIPGVRSGAAKDPHHRHAYSEFPKVDHTNPSSPTRAQSGSKAPGADNSAGKPGAGSKQTQGRGAGNRPTPQKKNSGGGTGGRGGTSPGAPRNNSANAASSTPTQRKADARKRNHAHGPDDRGRAEKMRDKQREKTGSSVFDKANKAPLAGGMVGGALSTKMRVERRKRKIRRKVISGALGFFILMMCMSLMTSTMSSMLTEEADKQQEDCATRDADTQPSESPTPTVPPSAKPGKKKPAKPKADKPRKPTTLPLAPGQKPGKIKPKKHTEPPPYLRKNPGPYNPLTGQGLVVPKPSPQHSERVPSNIGLTMTAHDVWLNVDRVISEDRKLNPTPDTSRIPDYTDAQLMDVARGHDPVRRHRFDMSTLLATQAHAAGPRNLMFPAGKIPPKPLPKNKQVILHADPTAPDAAGKSDSHDTFVVSDQRLLDNVAVVAGVAKQLWPNDQVRFERATLIAVITMIPETHLLNPASSNVPGSEKEPYDTYEKPGDHDSIGLFQQRALQGYHGNAHQIMDRQYASYMFFGHPKAIKGPMPSNPDWGLDDYKKIKHKDWVNVPPGEVAAKIQRPAAQYEYRYGMWVKDAPKLIKAAGVDMTGATPSTANACGDTKTQDGGTSGVPGGSGKFGVDEYGAYYRKKYGHMIDPDERHEGGGQCVGYTAYMVGTYPKYKNFTNMYKGYHFGDAKLWADAARHAGIKVDTTPAPGAVVQYRHGAHGHVALVTDVNPDGSFNVNEYNYSPPQGLKFGTRKNLHMGKDFENVLHFEQ